MPSEPFWKRKSFGQMTQEEWESLCDGCGKCCLLKLEFEDTGEVCPTSVACKLLDAGTCRCTRYARRREFVPDCITLTPETIEDHPWLPSTCAYRLLNEGRDLPWWHHLVSGSRRTVHEAGISVRHRVVSEAEVGSDAEVLLDHLVDWKL